MRKTSLLILILSILSLFAVGFASTNADYVSDTGYYAIIEDDANLFSDEQAILDTMKYITEYTNTACYTTDTNSRSVETLARERAEEYFSNDSGVIFVIDMENRMLYLYACNGTDTTISVKVCETITDNVYRYASDGDYDACAIAAFKQIYQKLSGKHIPEPMRWIGNAFLAIMIGMSVSAVWACHSSRIQVKMSQVIDVQINVQNPQRQILKVSKTHRSSDTGGSSGGYSGGGGGGGNSGGGGGHKF